MAVAGSDRPYCSGPGSSRGSGRVGSPLVPFKGMLSVVWTSPWAHPYRFIGLPALPPQRPRLHGVQYQNHRGGHTLSLFFSVAVFFPSSYFFFSSSISLLRLVIFFFFMFKRLIIAHCNIFYHSYFREIFVR